MPNASWPGINVLVATVGAAVSSAPMFGGRRLPWFGTPRLKEPISRRKRFKYCSVTGLPNKTGGGLVSVKISGPAGGEVKSFTLTVQLRPPWQFAQPAFKKSERPLAMSAGTGAPGAQPTGNGALGVRTALRTHSR